MQVRINISLNSIPHRYACIASLQTVQINITVALYAVSEVLERILANQIQEVGSLV